MPDNKQQPTPKRKPILVTNPNDPRLRAYNDSLTLYNNTKGHIDKIKTMSADDWWDFTGEWAKNKGKQTTQAGTRLQKLNGRRPSPVKTFTPAYREGDEAREYAKPVQPYVLEQPEKIFPRPAKAQAKIQITAPQQSQIPVQQGDPVYGPANSTIGYLDNGSFSPYQGVNQRGIVNNPDTELLANPAELKKYLSLKGIQYENGGSMGTLYSAYRKNKLAGGGFLNEDISTINTEIPPVIGGGSRAYVKPQGSVNRSLDTGTGAGQGTLGTSANRNGNKINWGAAVGGVASLGTEIIDSTGKGDPLTGRKSIGSSIGKGALSGAAAGTSIAPGWGTLIGAVVGGAAGWITGGANRRKARRAMGNEINANRVDAMNYSANLAASNPSIYEGYRNSDYYGKYGGKMTKFGMGGSTEMSTPLATMYMHGGRAKSLSSNNAELIGNSHQQGGIHIPEMNAEVEGGETTVGDYVFSKKLGFADIHKPIAKAKGKIEAKPPTRERINALRRLNAEEQNMILSQEYLKKQLKIA